MRVFVCVCVFGGMRVREFMVVSENAARVR